MMSPPKKWRDFSDAGNNALTARAIRKVSMSKEDEEFQYRDILDLIMDYEAGNLGTSDCVKLFQRLIDEGLADRLQGHYGRKAAYMIDQKICTPRKETDET